MEKVYLASPYSSGIPNHWAKNWKARIMGERFQANIDAANWLIKQGYAVYAPIIHWHPVAVKHKLPRDAKFWKSQNDAMLSWCTTFTILKLKGWEKSDGLIQEMKEAMELDKEVILMSLLSKEHRYYNKLPKYKLEPHNVSTAA